MANVTRDELIQAAELVPPSSKVTEGQILPALTGFFAYIEHGSALQEALQSENPREEVAKLYNPDAAGDGAPLVAGTPAPDPAPVATVQGGAPAEPTPGTAEPTTSEPKPTSIATPPAASREVPPA